MSKQTIWLSILQYAMILAEAGFGIWGTMTETIMFMVASFIFAAASLVSQRIDSLDKKLFHE